jgi:hypothetical protein
MSGVRPNRSISALQVGSLRYDRSSIPANGGMVTVNGQGQIAVASEVTAEKITAPIIVNAGTLSANTATFTEATITKLNATEITITGTTSFDQLSVTGDADICGALIVTDVTVRDVLNTNILEVEGTALFMDAVTVDSTLLVNETLNVVGAVTLHSGLDVTSGGATISDNLYVSGKARVGTGLTVDSGGATLTAGNLTLTSGSIDVTGGATLSSGLRITNGGVTLNTGNLTLSSGNINVTGGATLSSRLLVTGGGASITGGVTMGSTLTVPYIVGTTAVFSRYVEAKEINAEWLDVSGMKIGNNIDISGNFTVDKISTFRGPATFKGRVDVSGMAVFHEDVTFTKSVVIHGEVTDVDIIKTEKIETDGVFATEICAGSSVSPHDFGGYKLDVVGGARVTNGLSVTGGNIVVSSGGVSVSGNSTFGNTLTVSSGGVSVSGNSTFGDTLTVSSGDIVVSSGGVSMNNGATVGSTLTVNGGALIKRGLAIDGSGAVIADGLTVTNDGAVIVGGLLVYDDTHLANGLDVSGAVRFGGILDVSGQMFANNGVRALTDAARRAGPAIDAPVSAGYVDANALRIFKDEDSGATLGPLRLPGGTTYPNGAALVWDNPAFGSGNGNAQLVVGTGRNTITGGKFEVYTGVRDIVPTGLSPQMSLDASGSLTITGTATASRIALMANGGPAGPTSYPSIYWINDISDGINNTGINHPGNNKLTLITGGTTRLYLDDDKVSIGSHAPNTGNVTTTIDIVPGKRDNLANSLENANGWTSIKPLTSGGSAGGLGIFGTVAISGYGPPLGSVFDKSTDKIPTLCFVDGAYNTGINHPQDDVISVVVGTDRLVVTSGGATVNGNLVVTGTISGNLAYSVQSF